MKRHKHSLSNYKLFTCEMGNLIPINMMEVLPGDTIQGNSSVLLRVSPLLAPVMHPVQVRIHHWFVPNRILADEWEDFITGESTVHPDATLSTAVNESSLYDYLGITPQAANGETINSYPMRAYHRIWSEWYRDQDLQAEAGSAQQSNILRQCAWEKDYFTTARPWPQKGGDVTVPLRGQAAVFRSITGTDGQNVTAGDNNQTWDINGVASQYQARLNLAGYGGEIPNVAIDDLREAFALQRYAEARARYGSRYTEYLRYLGVNPADSRLQRPEYLGGGKQTISFSEILQTAEGSNPVGEMRGHGIAALKTNRFRKFIPEHGIMMTLMSVRPKTMYTQGLNRIFSKSTKEDYWQRELEHIGQQEVLNKEVYFAGDGQNDEVFGYQDRYSEYRQIPSTIAGEFHSTLNYWHMARDFSSRPALNGPFINCVPTKRIHADQTGDVLWCMAHNNVKARRMVSRNTQSFVR